MDLLVTALNHPLRRRILRRMHGVQIIGPRGIAEEFDQPVGNVAYHMRVLVKARATELVERKPVRGAIANFYRRSKPLPDWAEELIDADESDG